jgi:predicted nucleic acid-binding protein
MTTDNVVCESLAQRYFELVRKLCNHPQTMNQAGDCLKHVDSYTLENWKACLSIRPRLKFDLYDAVMILTMNNAAEQTE